MPVFQLSDSIFFPPPELAREDGLLAIGGDLSPERLLMAYQMGIFPWYSQGEPILWWSPTPRLILQPHKFHLSKRLARELKKGAFSITADTVFSEVINNCSKPRAGQSNSTWITKEMRAAYCTMHERGYAHSIESWHKGELVGGVYGISLGGVFFGESMFATKSNASKAALYALSQKLALWDFDFIDCQMHTSHLSSLGAEEISGPQFFSTLQKSIFRSDHRGKWTL
nr:leucyl/phenylalanyl-tRNA--protein transferase [Desulfobulbaceae bacterium]